MLISKALALAAVEVLEGAPRELSRKRRRSGFQAAGPHEANMDEMFDILESDLGVES